MKDKKVPDEVVLGIERAADFLVSILNSITIASGGIDPNDAAAFLMLPEDDLERLANIFAHADLDQPPDGPTIQVISGILARGLERAGYENFGSIADGMVASGQFKDSRVLH